MAADNTTNSIGTVRLAFTLVWAAGRGTLLLILAATVITSLAVAGQLLVGRSLLDLLAGTTGVATGELVPYLILLGGLLMASALSQAATTELRIPLGEKVQRRTMDDVLDVATEVELEFYEGSDFHDRLERARAAAGGQSSAVVFGLVTMMSTLVVAVGVIGVLFTVAPVLVPIAVISYFPIAFVNVRNNRAQYQMERDLTELQRERVYLEVVLTSREMAKEVRAYDIAGTFRRWHSDLWDIRLGRLRDLVRKRLVLTTFGAVVNTAAMIATLSFALILAGRNVISIGDAAVAIVGLQQLSSRLRSTGTAFTNVHQGITFLRDFESFRAELPNIRKRRPTAIPPTPPTTLTVEGLGYRYPGAQEDAVRSVSFELRRGQVMAIVGANGSGKTTLSKVIGNLLPPTRGKVCWDGVDIAVCDPALVRAQMAPVFQDFAKFMLTIRSSIALGDINRIDDEEGIERAAIEAGVDDLIRSNSAGIDTRLGKVFAGGTDASIGQWQRLAIARALFRDAPIVILDEPSASLDPQAEADLFDLLHELCFDRIVLFVSHRFATVRSADAVVVMDHGDVVEMGSHVDLMRSGGLYHDLFNLQADRYGLRS
ncbi:ABC transporter ATP-binding protein [Ilumatobacter nonamiensis]|uniref:ABC transporter ATP-binding protein n=1 Tax=Ilumatobacter nonamiensis TaxID=467093 RepID=UPI00034BB4B4|nr:ABC transporter ATP-binding protein [Ilumatobacter nonamiensis]